MAKSSFSQLAALFNPSCVVRNRDDAKHSPLSRWVEVTDYDPSGKGHAVDWHAFRGAYNASAVKVVGASAGQSLAEQLSVALDRCL